MLKYITLVFLFIANFSFSQDHITLNPEERAYMFHIVKKSPILEQNIGRYLEYTGPEVKFANGAMNYDSVELLIMNNPDYLVIHHNEIAKSTKGIIAEVANKMAIYELNQVLLAQRTDNDFEKYKARFEKFEMYLIQDLPSIVVDRSHDKPSLVPRFHNVLNPVLTFDDKIAQLRSFRGMTPEDEVLIINAMAVAINKYVEERAFQIYLSMGGRGEIFKNVLTAAGDGSTTSGMLEEREKDEKGRWNKGLPKAVGLFPYQALLVQPEKVDDDPTVEPAMFTSSDFNLVGNNKMTTLHFDVWGYNTDKQTTVVIEKNGLSYHLFGSGETRFLTPDSTFSKGKTFQTVINQLEFVKIADLTEKIYGKKGFDYWIKHYEEKKDETELKIIKNEKAYSDMGYSPITTSSKPSRKVKKSQKRAKKAKSGADSWSGGPTTESGSKSRKKLQNEIVYLYERFDWYKAKIKELEEEKAIAVELREKYLTRLDTYKTMMGRNWATYEMKDGLYVFQDSTTFDYYTQEFTFPASEKTDGFDVRLIAIPQSAMSTQADEVMLHVSMVDAIPEYNARLRLEMVDVFGSDEFKLDQALFHPEDSISVRQFFEVLLDPEQEFEIIARGNGVGQWNGANVVRSAVRTEESNYGSLGKMHESYVRLRRSEVLVDINRKTVLQVNSFTDPVKSNLNVTNEELLKLQAKYNLSKNDVLSALRTAEILKKLKAELNVLAGTYLTREEAKIVIDRFNKEFDSVRISMGGISVKLSEL